MKLLYELQGNFVRLATEAGPVMVLFRNRNERDLLLLSEHSDVERIGGIQVGPLGSQEWTLPAGGRVYITKRRYHGKDGI